MEHDFLLISGIQHFCFCRRQWALIHIENFWNENGLTAAGRAMHEKVHDKDCITSRNGVVTLRGLAIKSEELRITGACDAIELIPDENGIIIHGREGKWRIYPVEYKHGSPKKDDSDRLQLTAQCMCLEEMLLCDISEAALYYGKTHHREEVRIDDELRNKVKRMIGEMRRYFDSHYTPRAKYTKACDNCSLQNNCIPELFEKLAVSKYVADHIHEDLK